MDSDSHADLLRAYVSGKRFGDCERAFQTLRESGIITEPITCAEFLGRLRDDGLISDDVYRAYGEWRSALGLEMR